MGSRRVLVSYVLLNLRFIARSIWDWDWTAWEEKCRVLQDLRVLTHLPTETNSPTKGGCVLHE